jgi:phosphoribosylcarboxyaminoimidazole (NCAIR) mutase
MLCSSSVSTPAAMPAPAPVSKIAVQNAAAAGLAKVGGTSV